MGAIIIVAQNHKGGVGKTTFVANTAHVLANQGYKLLCVDFDTQCNLTELLLPPGDVPEKSLYDLLSNPDVTIEECIMTTQFKNVYCLPNTENTGALMPYLMSKLPESYYIPRNLIQKYARENYDFVLIDTPPALEYSSLSALWMADFVVVPVTTGSKFALRGLSKAIKAIQEISSNGNSNLRFLRLLINNMDLRTSFSKIFMDKLRTSLSDSEIFKTTIPINTDFHKAEEAQRTVIRYNPGSPGAKAYRQLAQEILEILGKN